MKLSVVTAIVVHMATAPLFAEEVKPDSISKDYTAEAMLELCRGNASGTAKELQSMICTFRLQGITNILILNCGSINDGFSPAPNLTAGFPPSKGAVRQAYKNFMEENPELWGKYWSDIAALAISTTFPCEN